MKSIVCSLGLGLLLGAAPARAQAAPGFGLNEALTLMRASHPALVAAREGIRAADADTVSAKLWTNPVLAGSYTKGAANSSYDRLGYVYYGVTQFVEVANAPGARGRSAQRTASAVRSDLRATEVDLTLTVEADMIDLVTRQRTAQLLARALDLLSSVGKIVSDRVAAGAAPRYDATRIGVTIAMARADLTQAEADRARALAELRGAVGPLGTQLRGEASYPLDQGPPLPEPEVLLKWLEAHRPDVEAARQRSGAAEADIVASRKNVLPGVGVTVAGGYGAAPKQVDVGVGLTLAVPVIDRGQGVIAAARARAEQARANVRAVLGPASARIADMHAAIVLRRRASEEYEAHGVATDEMLSEAQAGYLAGRFSVLELADAYVSWRDARLKAIGLLNAARQAEIELGRELGQPLREPLADGQPR